MEHGRKLLLVLMVLLIGACNAKTPENVSDVAASSAADVAKQSANTAAPKDSQHDQSSDEDASVLRSSYGECIKVSGGVVPEMQACIEEEYKYQDERLNNDYRRLLIALEGSNKIELKSKQRQWLAERDSACGESANNEEGQGQRIEANDCFLEMTAKRAAELEAMATERLDAFVEGNAKILASQQGDLRGSGGRDAVLVLDHPGTGNEKLGEGEPRTVLLLIRDGAGKLQKIGKNDKLVPCAQCGGMAGDPFGYIQVGKGQFTVLTEGGSRERWSNEYTFKYSAGPQDWLLDRAVRTVTDTETGEEKHVELTNKDFGLIHFEKFDPETLPKMEEK